MTSIMDMIAQDLARPYIVVDGDSAIHFMRDKEIVLTSGAHVCTITGGTKLTDTMDGIFQSRGKLLLELEVRWSQNLFKLARGIPPTTTDGRNYVMARTLSRQDMDTTTDVFVVFVSGNVPAVIVHAKSDGWLRVFGYEYDYPDEAVLAMFKDLILPYVRTVVTDSLEESVELKTKTSDHSEEVLEEIFPEDHPPVPTVTTRGVRIARWMVIVATLAMTVLVAVVPWSTKG